MEDNPQICGVFLAIVILVSASTLLVRSSPRAFRWSSRVAKLGLHILAFPFQGIRKFLVSHQNREINLTRGQVLIHDSPVTPLQFLALVENIILTRAIPNATVTYVLRREGGFLSARRNYLRVKRISCVAMIGAVPLGNALLVTWRVGDMPSAALALVFEIASQNALIEQVMRRPTIYREDALIAFQGVVRDSILECRAHLTGQAVRAGHAYDRVPRLRDF